MLSRIDWTHNVPLDHDVDSEREHGIIAKALTVYASGPACSYRSQQTERALLSGRH